MSLIHGPSDSSPGTHVILIGVGAYPHLIGGTGQKAQDTFGLKQLSSPPVSARSLADWFLDPADGFHNPNAPLASLELLLSEGDTKAEYVTPAGVTHKVKLPTKQAMKTAIRGWNERADSHLDNIAFFYFCGHGLSKGNQISLLPRDFEAPGTILMENAIDFEAMANLPMEGCKARRQCFLIDACRNEPAALKNVAETGDRMVLKGSLDVTFDRARDWQIIYATARDDRSHGRAGKPSRFADAVLTAFRGAGSDDPSGDWVVDTLSFMKGINGTLDLENRRPKVPKQRARLDGQDSGFQLHFLRSDPEIPVAIDCHPKSVCGEATLSVSGPSTAKILNPDPEGWQFALTATEETYELQVTLADGAPRDGGPLRVRPAYREKRIDVP